METEIDENDLSALSRIKKIQFLLIKDFYLKTYREHEEFLNAYDEKVKKIAQMEAKISKEVPFSFSITSLNIFSSSFEKCQFQLQPKRQKASWPTTLAINVS